MTFADDRISPVDFKELDGAHDLQCQVPGILRARTNSWVRKSELGPRGV